MACGPPGHGCKSTRGSGRSPDSPFNHLLVNLVRVVSASGFRARLATPDVVAGLRACEALAACRPIERVEFLSFALGLAPNKADPNQTHVRNLRWRFWRRNSSARHFDQTCHRNRLAGRDPAFGHSSKHSCHCVRNICCACDWRQVEHNRTVLARRHQSFDTKTQCCGIARERKLDRLPRQGFSFALKQRLGRDR
jgi:hypothetical protein